jgi:hypothetical protein
MFLGGWVGGWMEVKAVLSIAYSNQKTNIFIFILGALSSGHFTVTDGHCRI